VFLAGAPVLEVVPIVPIGENGKPPLTTNLTRAALSAMTRASRLTLSRVVVTSSGSAEWLMQGRLQSTSTVGFDQMRSLR
jgi:hypothetical protein